MKLTYNVLCVDDDISLLSSLKEGFRTFNESVGIRTEYQDIEVKIGAREDPADFKNRIEQDLASKFQDATFEFILVDLHMTGGMNGEHIISAIRGSHSIYRPIIFYSAGTPPADDTAIKQLTEEAERADILGKSIFITPRSTLQTKLEEIASEMHKEEHKINQVRGLLMDQVSELDANIINVVETESIWNAVPVDKRDGVVKEFKERMNSKLKSTNDVHGATKDMNYDEIKTYILSNPMTVDTFTKGKVLREMLRNIDRFKQHGETLSEAINGNDSLIAIRNAYGHKTANDLVAGHDDAKCKRIREESRRHVKNIKEVSGA